VVTIPTVGVRVVQLPRPDWAATWTAIGTLVIALGVFVAIFALAQDRRAQHAAVAANFTQRWTSPEMTAIRIEILTNFVDTFALRDGFLKARDDDLERFYRFSVELGFLEELGVLQRHGGVGLKWIRHLLYSPVVDRWRCGFDHLVLSRRRESSDPLRELRTARVSAAGESSNATMAMDLPTPV